MNPITLPIIITIAVIGIIAIIIVKLFYKDLKVSDLSDDLPLIVNEHWEEPIGKNQELENGIASKVFQEPMHSKHRNIISKDYEKKCNVSYIQTENAQITREYEENKQSNLDSFENKNFDENINENNNGSFRVIKSEDSNYPNNEYITPREYSSQNYDEYGNINEREEIDSDRDIYTENNNKYLNSYENYNENRDLDRHSDKVSKDYDSYEEEPLSNPGVFDMGEQAIVGGKSYTIKVGNDIIFNYNGETYSSRILEIKHENIRVKYRAQEKWISFSDIKKVF